MPVRTQPTGFQPTNNKIPITPILTWDPRTEDSAAIKPQILLRLRIRESEIRNTSRSTTKARKPRPPNKSQIQRPKKINTKKQSIPKPTP